MSLRFFVVDDDLDYAALLRYQLRRQGESEVLFFSDGESALEHLQAHPDAVPDLVLLDVVMPGQGGLETLKQMKALQPEMPVVIVSAQSAVSVALEAMQLGAYDYITKGHDDTIKLASIVQHIRERADLVSEVATLRERLPSPQAFGDIITESAAMTKVLRLLQKTLRGDLSVAIQGESGTGKELIARAIHDNSPRRRGPFVVVNCAAIPRESVESEFFGHEKGSFTGAHARKKGRFEQADGGTLFLDEIGELDIDLQAKLLRALQSREVQRVGGSETICFDARILCATNQDVRQMMQKGTFREDLYYRLFQFPIQLPPLRERDHDVLLLANSFCQTFLQKHPDLEKRTFSAATRRTMLRYGWPGNVRELKNAVERALLISDAPEITPYDLLLDRAPGASGDDQALRQTSGSAANGTSASYFNPVPPAAHPDDIVPLEDVKRMAVQQAYNLCRGNVNQTATRLGVTRSTIYRLLKKYDIET